MSEKLQDQETNESAAQDSSKMQDQPADIGEEKSDEEGDEREETGSHSGSRRTKLWIAVGFVVAVGLLLVVKQKNKPESGPPLAAVGSTITGDLTLVTADRNELECQAAKGFQSFQCGFTDDKQQRQVLENEKLRPFMTVDRQLFLIPGLFLEPAISQRYDSEPPNKPRPELKRFVAKCKITVIGTLDGVKLRWSPTGDWEPAKTFSVANASECTIEG
jgi:hypothetical protein